jgi:branched-chain amino acid transport system substrate-binding protein
MRIWIKTIAVASVMIAAAALQARADILVGIAGPMTGSDAAFGEQFRRGANKAIDDINAKGGVLGQKLQAVVGDDACDPKQAVSVANDLVSKKVAVVIGHFCSSSSIPASSVYAEANLVEISPASTNPQLTERGLANVFRVCGRDDVQGPTGAKWVASHFKGKRVAVIDDKSTYGQGLADEFKKELNKLGIKEVLRDSVTAGEKDYSPLVTKLKQAKVGVIYWGGYYTEGGLIVRQMRDQGLKTVLVGGDALNDPAFWAITGPAGEGTLLTFGPDATLDPKNAALVAWFKTQNYDAEAYTLYSYAAIQAWVAAVKKVGSVDSAKVEAALRADKVETTLGRIGFDKKGDVTAPGFIVYEWTNGKAVYAKK